MYDHRAATCPAATANRCGEVGATPQSLRRGQHDYLGIAARTRLVIELTLFGLRYERAASREQPTLF